MINFEQWFRQQDFYTNMMFIYGNKLFDHDGDFYRVLAVHIAYQVWQDRQAELDKQQKRIDRALPFLDRAYKFTNNTSGNLAILDAQAVLRGESEK